MKPPALVLFVKAARPGEVKTRLSPSLSPEQACRMHRAFAEDLVALTADLGADRFLATNDVTDAFVADLARRAGIGLVAQHPGDLGERMLDVQSKLAPDHAGVVILGGDCPTLPAPYVRDALLPAGRDVVLGPATDGGYYLIGAPGPTPELFAGMPWGGPAVLAQTLERATRAAQGVRLLPFWYDVDTPDALALLGAHLAHLSLDVAPVTREALRQIDRGAAPRMRGKLTGRRSTG